MQLFAGLGNPGSQYEHNRHNVGFMAVDEIHRHHSFAPWRRKFQALISEGTIGGSKVLLMKPTTFMNESGRAVREAVAFYKLAPDQVLVIYDEMDLPAGKIRMKQGGGHGGHNGPRSVHAHIGGEYRRLRIGVGHPGDKHRVTNWVLSDFAKSDQDWLQPLMDEIARNAEFLAKQEDATFASKVHLGLGGNAAKPGKTKTTNVLNTEPESAAKQQPRRTRDSAPSNPFADALGRLFGKSDGSA